MSEWISYKDNPPTKEILAYVKNEKGWMNGQIALYRPENKVFVSYNTESISKFTLDVTHYVELPW